MNIGTPYDEKNYNCAHYVIDWYKSKNKIVTAPTNVYSRAFVVSLFRQFTEVCTPIDDDLVVMYYPDRRVHIGVYSGGFIYHNYKPELSLGSVVKWTPGVTKRVFPEIRYGRLNENNTCN